MNQRALFEKLKMEFSEAENSKTINDGPTENLDEAQRTERLKKLETEVRRLNQENARLKTSALQFQEEAAEHLSEVSNLVDGNSKLQSDLEECKFRFQKEEASWKGKLEEVAVLLQQQTADMARLTEQKRVAETNASRLGEENQDLTGDRRIHQEQLFQLEKSYKEATEELTTLRRDHTELRRNLEVATRNEDVASRQQASTRNEAERLAKETRDKDNELANVKRLLDEVMKSHVPVEDMKKWKARAEKFEQQYEHVMRYNKEMTSAVGHMTQAASERGGEVSDIQQMTAHLQREHERKDQELKMAELEKQDLQKQLDNVQSSCTYFQSKYKSTAADSKKWQQEHAAASEKATLLAQTAASSQREVEQLRAQVSKLQQKLGGAQQMQQAHPSGYAQHPAASHARQEQRSQVPHLGLAQVAEHEPRAAYPAPGDAGASSSRSSSNTYASGHHQQHSQQQQQRAKEQAREPDPQLDYTSGRPSLLTSLNVKRPGY